MTDAAVRERNVGSALYLGVCAIWLTGMITVHTLQWYHVIPDMRVTDRVCEDVSPTNRVGK